MWTNNVEWSRPQIKLRRMHNSCWVPKATNTHSDCVTLIACPLQQLLHERTRLNAALYFLFCLYKYAVTVWQIPDAVDAVVCAPDDGWNYHQKHVERFPDINKLCNVASCWIFIWILLGTHNIRHISRIRVNNQQSQQRISNRLRQRVFLFYLNTLQGSENMVRLQVREFQFRVI
jgi:hypothetical protein